MRDDSRPAHSHQRRVLVAVTMAAALTPLNSTMISVALPSIAADFGAAAPTVTVWVVTGYLIATLVSQMPAGSVADRLGYARALSTGRWMFAAGTLSASLAPRLGAVIAGRLLMAVGGALLMPTAMAMLRSVVPQERRPRAFGLMGAVIGSAAALGPALGGLVSARLGWRSLFLVNLPLLLVSWWLQPPALVDERPRGERPGFDWTGSLLLAVALVLVVGATRTAVPFAYFQAASALILLLVLLAWERRAAAPVIDVGLFRRTAFAAGAGVIALQNLAMYALLFQIPFLFGASPQSTGPRLGLVVMAMTATMAVSSPVGGWLAVWAGIRALVLCGGTLGAAGIAALTQLPASAPPAAIAARLVLVGLGLGLSTGPSQAAALSAVDQRSSGMAAAMVSMLRYLGAIVGTAVLGFALAGRGVDLARHHVALWVFVSAFAASGCCAFGLPSRSKQRSEAAIGVASAAR